MAWNEPGGNKPRDPWGGGGDQGPPDMDEVIKQLRDRLSGLFGGKKSGGNNGASGNAGGGVPLFVIAAVLVIFYGLWASFAVDNKERAVVLTFGKYSRTLGPGLNWHFPPFESYAKVNIAQRKIRLEEEMLTRDTNIVGVDLEIQYKVIDPLSFLLKSSTPEEVLINSTESALRQVVGSSSMDDVLILQREAIAEKAKILLQEYQDKYSTGIQIDNFVLDETRPPDAVRGAFTDVVNAKEDEERLQNEAQAYANEIIPVARGQAQRRLEEAQAYKQELVANATGDASRFSDLLAEYRKAPQVTRDRLYLETMEVVLSSTSKVVVDVKEGNNMFYLPLDQLMKERKGSPSSASKSNANTSTVSQGNSGYGSRSGGLR